jgi:hypothetical protein
MLRKTVFIMNRLLPLGKKVAVARCECVFDVHTSNAIRINVKTTGGFINISVEDFHMVKPAP